MQCNGTSFHKFSKSSNCKKTLILEKSAESDFPILRSIYWGLLNVQILKIIRSAYFTNFWKKFAFPVCFLVWVCLKYYYPSIYVSFNLIFLPVNQIFSYMTSDFFSLFQKTRTFSRLTRLCLKDGCQKSFCV